MTKNTPRSYLSRRLWILDNRIVTSQQLDGAGAHRLRAILLGNFWADNYDGVRVMAEADDLRRRFSEKALKCGLPLSIWIIWNNVRNICETGQNQPYHLSDEEARALKSGKVLTFRDRFGEFRASRAVPKLDAQSCRR